MVAFKVTDDQKFDWIPPQERTRQQMLITGEFHEQIGTFESRGQFLSDLPDRVLLYELEKKALGQLMPRPHQKSGSCVGVGGARAYCHAQCGDVVVRGDYEEILFPFPFMTYGVGRQIAGFNRTGSGSYGGAQAKAVEQFGMLPYTDPRFPKPTIKNGWIAWTEREEIQWSHPKAWPVAYDDLKPDAEKYQILDVTRVTSIEGLLQALAQGYGVTTASSFGTRPRVSGDVLLGPWNTSWAHQQSWSGYWKHPRHGLIIPTDNQWNDVHGHCPTLYELGVTGSYWMYEKDVEKILRNGEVYAHSNTEGFPKRMPNFTL